MKKLPIPDNFEGTLFEKAYGYTPCADDKGNIINVPDDAQSLDDCCYTQEQINAQLIYQAWKAGTDYVGNVLSADDKQAQTVLLFLPTSPDTVKALIMDNFKWVNDVWKHYYVIKASILAGNPLPIDFSSVGSLPHAFQEINDALAAAGG